MQKLTQQQLEQLTAEMNNYLAETGKQRFPAAKADELRELGAKRCSKCATVQLIEGFPKDSSKRDGLQARCKACACAVTSDYYQKNTDKVLEYDRAYREKNRERIIEYAREYKAANRERISEYFHTRYRTDEHHRLSRQLNEGYHRAVRAGNTADWITAEQLLTYWSAKGIPALECYLTGDSLTPFDRSVDHVVSIANGGGHTVDNLLPCAYEANQRKANLEPDEAKQKLTNDNPRR